MTNLESHGPRAGAAAPTGFVVSIQVMTYHHPARPFPPRRREFPLGPSRTAGILGGRRF
uniref:Uncharacterized protein n=1 Tax=Arundo donax TaxID=35708 RepID=A0A0A9AJX0_ARUDO